MKTKTGCINNTLTAIFSAFILVILAATYAAPAQASTTTEGYQATTKAPVQLAWWNPGWRGGPRYTVCPRVCWRGYWGHIHCARRC